ncbi:hypothetical protein, partial [Chryseobacterium sp.]|uniref:hypothetical protein n=1 Tax=Chryseobacterium sp. TaxID=1871047 RepID=UPI0025C2AB1C
MRKKIIPWLLPVAISLFTLHSCSTEDDYMKSNDEKYTSNKFQVFSAQDGKTINYADGFKTLMERYDSLYNVSHTAKTMKRSFSKSEAVSTEYIEFNIRSQEFTTDNKEKYVLFPLVRNYQVDGIMVASLRENETIVEYYEMSTGEKNSQEILRLFKTQYVKTTVNKRLSKSACGFDGYPPCDIDTVIITVPKGGNGNGLPSGGSGGTSGGCSIYENCIDGNLDGGGGGGAPDLELSTCLQVRIQRSNPDFKNKVSDLQSKLGLKGETGYTQRTNNNYNYHDTSGSTDNSNTLSLPKASLPENYDIFGYMHTHPNDYTYTDEDGNEMIREGIKMFSPADVWYFMDMIKNAQEQGRPLSEVYAVMISIKGNYQIRFVGNQYQIKTFTPAQISNFTKDYIKYMAKFSGDLELGFL